MTPSLLHLASRPIVGTRWEAPAKRIVAALTGNRNCAYDWQTIAVMQRVLRPDSNAIDAGAFEGGMLRHMRRLAPRGCHAAFEPNPDAFRKLSDAFHPCRAALPGVDLHPFALGAAPGEVPFHRAVEHPALSGLRDRPEYLRGERTEEIRVRMETLDRVIPVDRPIAFVKIDVEGAELGVLRGGMETLRRSRPVVVFESGLGGADYFGTRPEDIHDLLTTEIGLRVSLMESWLRGGAVLSREEFRRQFDEGLNFYFIAHP